MWNFSSRGFRSKRFEIGGRGLLVKKRVWCWQLFSVHPLLFTTISGFCKPVHQKCSPNTLPEASYGSLVVRQWRAEEAARFYISALSIKIWNFIIALMEAKRMIGAFHECRLTYITAIPHRYTVMKFSLAGEWFTDYVRRDACQLGAPFIWTTLFTRTWSLLILGLSLLTGFAWCYSFPSLFLRCKRSRKKDDSN